MNEFKRKQWVRIGLSLLAVILAALFLTGIIGGKHLKYHPKDEATPMFKGVWDTMEQNGENSTAEDYLEQDPYLVNIYEGYGFAKDYKAARGHAFTLEDVSHTARPHPKANCITCKSADFTKLVNRDGVGVYSLPFESVMGQMTEGISCYTCHGDDNGNSGQLAVTHSYVTKALGDNASEIDLKVLNCGQCHIEYYFTPDESETMMPYHSVAEMTPDAILNYYDTMEFKDWEQPGTGTPMLKAQHPEMETFLPSKHSQMGLTCSSCHMADATATDGNNYHSHYLESPLNNPKLMETCASCHGSADAARALVVSTQERVTTREKEVGMRLSGLKDELTAAVAEDRLSEEDLKKVRQLHREAQWYFDFCYVENSEGAHNSKMSMECLDKADERIAQAMAILKGEPLEEPKPEEQPAGSGSASGTFTADRETAFSFIHVKAEAENGKITACEITSEAKEGSQDFMTPEIKEAWAKSVVENQSAENDVISGATITVSSGAVKEAVADIQQQMAAAPAEEPKTEEKPAEEKPAEEPVAEEKSAEEPKAEEPKAEEPAAADGLVYGSYLAEKETPFSVIRVLISARNGEIINCKITSVAKEGSQDFITPAIRNDWEKSIVESQSAENDVISGATITVSSGAVKEAVADIQRQMTGEGTAAPAEEPKAEEKPAEEPAAEEKPAEEPKTEEKPAEEPAAEEKPAEEPKAEEKHAAAFGGYAARRETPFSTIRVIVSTQGGVITRCKVICEAKEGQTEIDTVSGATVSSDAVRDAMAEILDKIR